VLYEDQVIGEVRENKNGTYSCYAKLGRNNDSQVCATPQSSWELSSHEVARAWFGRNPIQTSRPDNARG
jgi:hypothetical protein